MRHRIPPDRVPEYQSHAGKIVAGLKNSGFTALAHILYVRVRELDWLDYPMGRLVWELLILREIMLSHTYRIATL